MTAKPVEEVAGRVGRETDRSHRDGLGLSRLVTMVVSVSLIFLVQISIDEFVIVVPYKFTNTHRHTFRHRHRHPGLERLSARLRQQSL